MCGNVGLAGTLERKHLETFTDMLIMDTLRGPHSTGVAGVKRQSKHPFQLAKAVGPAIDLIARKDYDDAVTMGSQVLIGHNRYKTIGDITKFNAHPFEFDHIVGSHNGTLEYWYRDVLDGPARFGTDSECLYFNMDKNGIRPTLEKVKGAWALVWYDRKSNSINFLRNEHRPLFFTFSEDRKVIAWASERFMLEAALERNKVAYLPVMYANDDLWFSYTVPDYNGDFKEAVKREVKGATESPFARNWAANRGAYGGYRGPQAATTSVTGGTGHTQSGSNGYYDGPKGWAAERQVAEAKKETVPFVEVPGKPGNRKFPTLVENLADPKTVRSVISVNANVEKLNDVPETNSVASSEKSTERSEKNKTTQKPLLSLPTLRRAAYKDPKGNLVMQAEFGRIASDGCGWCTANIRWGDKCLITGRAVGDILCEDHMDDPDAVGFMMCKKQTSAA